MAFLMLELETQLIKKIPKPMQLMTSQTILSELENLQLVNCQ